ncbi:hypothetical protein GCM10009764_40580 [Nocardia ninae]
MGSDETEIHDVSYGWTTSAWARKAGVEPAPRRVRVLSSSRGVRQRILVLERESEIEHGCLYQLGYPDLDAREGTRTPTDAVSFSFSFRLSLRSLRFPRTRRGSLWARGRSGPERVQWKR